MRCVTLSLACGRPDECFPIPNSRGLAARCSNVLVEDRLCGTRFAYVTRCKRLQHDKGTACCICRTGWELSEHGFRTGQISCSMRQHRQTIPKDSARARE